MDGQLRRRGGVAVVGISLPLRGVWCGSGGIALLLPRDPAQPVPRALLGRRLAGVLSLGGDLGLRYSRYVRGACFWRTEACTHGQSGKDPVGQLGGRDWRVAGGSALRSADLSS